jgi:adenine-specific DNA-methyltransferase
METIEKLDGKTLNLVKENISALKSLFPEAFSEEKIDFDKLRLLLGDEVETSSEKYSFNWHGKSEAIKLALKQSSGTLKPCVKDSKNWDTTKNLYIEGDNLEVLRILQGAYQNKVKMIYIDPPYNTGKDFVYKDSFKDNIKNYKEQVQETGKANPETAGRYHTNWLNMMYPRLKLARNLLKDDGVIFISIDDNEVHNLRKICDEIFGSENFVNEFIWRSGRTSAAIYTKEHEYVLAYSKNIESLNLIQYNEDDEIISDRAIKKISVKNPASEITFPSGMRFEAEDKVFPKEFGISEVITVVKGELKCNNKLLANEVTLRAGWIMKDMIEAWITGDEVYDSKGQRVTEFFFRENGVLQYVTHIPHPSGGNS